MQLHVHLKGIKLAFCKLLGMLWGFVLILNAWCYFISTKAAISWINVASCLNFVAARRQKFGGEEDMRL